MLLHGFGKIEDAQRAVIREQLGYLISANAELLRIAACHVDGHEVSCHVDGLYPLLLVHAKLLMEIQVCCCAVVVAAAAVVVMVVVTRVAMLRTFNRSL